MVKIKVDVQDAVKLLPQFVNSKDYVIDVTEPLSLISRQKNFRSQTSKIKTNHSITKSVSQSVSLPVCLRICPYWSNSLD